MTSSFHVSVKGARHEQEGTPCQDFATSYCKGDVAIAVVCDGHGGEPYFRSDIGAKFAAEAAVKAITKFVDEVDLKAIVGQAFRSFKMDEDAGELGNIFRPLTSTLLSLWKGKVFTHMQVNPFTTEELQRIPEAYRPYYDDLTVAASAYGTTLVAYAQCKDFWFGFQIGDGAMVVFQDGVCGMPIPIDEHCHDNLTTSLCDPTALTEFRFGVDGSGKFPSSAFVCTDGLTKTFKTEAQLGEYLSNMDEVVAKISHEDIVKELRSLYPAFSGLTSGDDISLACVHNQ